MEAQGSNLQSSGLNRTKQTRSKDIQIKFGCGQGRFIQFIFLIVAKSLYRIAELTKLSYNQINVLVYFFILPFLYLAILDHHFDFHYLKAAAAFTFLGFFIGCRNFAAYSDWLFAQSVKFLQFFKRYGMSYESASIWFCVVLPILLLLALLWI